MRTYGYSMLPLNNEVVPVLMPFYTAEEENSLQREYVGSELTSWPEKFNTCVGVNLTPSSLKI